MRAPTWRDLASLYAACPSWSPWRPRRTARIGALIIFICIQSTAVCVFVQHAGASLVISHSRRARNNYGYFDNRIIGPRKACPEPVEPGRRSMRKRLSDLYGPSSAGMRATWMGQPRGQVHGSAGQPFRSPRRQRALFVVIASGSVGSE